MTTYAFPADLNAKKETVAVIRLAWNCTLCVPVKEAGKILEMLSNATFVDSNYHDDINNGAAYYSMSGTKGVSVDLYSGPIYEKRVKTQKELDTEAEIGTAKAE